MRLPSRVDLFPYAIGACAIAALCAGSLIAGTERPTPGTYLILSRSLRMRTPLGQLVESCETAAYRWKLGSKDAPARIDSIKTPYDCAGYGVEDNKLYRSGRDGHDTYLDLFGRNTGERPRPSYGGTAISSIDVGDVRVEDTQDQSSGEGSLLRIFSRDGRLMNEKPIPGLGVDAVSPDGSRIYLSQRTDFPDGFMGPWPFLAYEWKTGNLIHLQGVENSFERAFDPKGHKMLYILNRRVPDMDENGWQHGWKSTTPSELHLLDLADGKDTLLRKAADGEPFSNPRFSPDGNRYLVQTPGADTLYDLAPDSPPLDAFMPYVNDWFGDTVVLDAPDSGVQLMVRDLEKKEDAMPSENFASFDYIGHIEVH